MTVNESSTMFINAAQHTVMIFVSGIFFLLLSSTIPTVVSAISCPNGCVGCEIEIMQCNTKVLKSIPEEVPSTVTLINIRNQEFQSTILNRNIFRNYKNVKFSQLSIIYANLEVIESDTFAMLAKNLKHLDLSSNQLNEVKPYAFRGLNLDILRLDENSRLYLAENAFEGLQVKSLSLTGCNLVSLPYPIIQPIMMSLTTLKLSNNKLTTLSINYNPLFYPNKQIELYDNPLNCNCDLLWLARALRTFHRERLDDNGYKYPTCSTPSTLRNSQIHLVRENQFYCSPPQLQEVDIQFSNSDSGILVCSAEGPLDMRLTWNSELQTSRTISAHRSKASVDFQRSSFQSEVDTYTCTATASTGSTTANVRVRWPKEAIVRPPIKVPINNNPGNSQNDQRLDYRNSQKENNNIRQPTNDEKNRATDNVDNGGSSIFFRKQFTLMEMIGSVIGTFTITLAIFLLIYRCCIYNKEKRRKKAGYPTYETTAYSDCQTYDLPQHPSYPPPPPPPPPNGPFLDFRTQRKMYNHV